MLVQCLCYGNMKISYFPDALDECAEDLASCSQFAICEDKEYNLRTYMGDPYLCFCPEGFINADDGLACISK